MSELTANSNWREQLTPRQAATLAAMEEEIAAATDEREKECLRTELLCFLAAIPIRGDM